MPESLLVANNVVQIEHKQNGRCSMQKKAVHSLIRYCLNTRRIQKLYENYMEDVDGLMKARVYVRGHYADKDGAVLGRKRTPRKVMTVPETSPTSVKVNETEVLVPSMNACKDRAWMIQWKSSI